MLNKIIKTEGKIASALCLYDFVQHDFVFNYFGAGGCCRITIIMNSGRAFASGGTGSSSGPFFFFGWSLSFAGGATLAM
jgi:hypothetical protein